MRNRLHIVVLLLLCLSDATAQGARGILPACAQDRGDQRIGIAVGGCTFEQADPNGLNRRPASTEAQPGSEIRLSKKARRLSQVPDPVCPFAISSVVSVVSPPLRQAWLPASHESLMILIGPARLHQKAFPPRMS